MENNSTWQQVYRLAAELFKLGPWDYLEESDVFGITIPETSKQYFVSIMGSAGNLMALTAYEGPEALARFWMLEDSETADAGDILSIPHMIVTFEKKEDIDEGQLTRFRALSNDPVFHHLFPEVRKVVPGQFPNEPDEAYLSDFAVILEQSLDVLRRAENDSDFIHPEDTDDETYLMREKENNEWTDQYRTIENKSWPITITWNREDIDQVVSLPQSNAVLQAHYQLMPFHVQEKDKPIFFPYAVVLVNKKSGRIEGTEMMVADPDLQTMLGKIPKQYLEFIKALGFRPRSVEAKNPVLEGLLEEPLRLCGIRLVHFQQLPAMAEAIQGMLEYMKK
jgi:hypothetical protein